jgi:AcrR family transcriptional regulator
VARTKPTKSLVEPRWRRDPEAKKVAILKAARHMFGARGYGSTTVRDIANEAGVNQSLVFRYFGSKEGLYASSVPEEGYIDSIFSDDLAESIRNLVRSMLVEDGGGAPPVAGLIRGASEKELSAMHRRGFDRIADHIEKSIDRADAALVSQLVFAWVIGIAVAHDILERDALVTAGPDAIAAVLVEAVASLQNSPSEKVKKPVMQANSLRNGRASSRGDGDGDSVRSTCSEG